MTSQAAHVEHTACPIAAARAIRGALLWAVGFVALHVYWALGGRIGFGDQDDPIPDTTSTVVGWIFTIVVGVMFAGGLVVPSALLRPWGRRIPRPTLVALVWLGAIVLLARGLGGLLDGMLRGVGIDHGLTGIPYEKSLGSAHPSRYTVWSAAAIDATFVLGGLLFARAARLTTVCRGTAR